MNKCLNCGLPVKNKYCNVSCQNSHQKRKPSKESIQKMKDTNRRKKLERLGELKIFKVNCCKCNKEFDVEEYEKKYPTKEKYHCSRSCANSRGPRSEETKKRISESINKYVEEHGGVGVFQKSKINKDIKCVKNCKWCNIEFTVEFNHRGTKYCSGSCRQKYRASSKTSEEWSSFHKKLYAEGKNFVAGGTTKWYDYKNIRVQGTYELRTCRILDSMLERNEILKWEYTKDRFTYIGIDCKEHMYLLDFKVYRLDNSFYYLETKGWIHENDPLKWEAVREKGHELIIWRDKDIKQFE